MHEIKASPKFFWLVLVHNFFWERFNRVYLQPTPKRFGQVWPPKPFEIRPKQSNIKLPKRAPQAYAPSISFAIQDINLSLCFTDKIDNDC